MFNSEVNNIASILKKFLGNPKDEYSYDGWSHWNCPCCADMKGVKSDNKYNLEINIRKNRFHCWVCGDSNSMKGKLSKLFKLYGNNDLLNEYKQEINSIRQSRLFQINENTNDFDDEFEIDNEIRLPIAYKIVNKDDKNAINAYKYLISRGISDRIIEKYNIGYIGNDLSVENVYRNRIVIPSYDKFGELNYWISRDYTNTSKRKYLNPDVEKKSIIFNEYNINWYENITLVEGVFDHIVTPNSIPLLGKSLKTDSYVFSTLISKAKANVNIFLDDDAISDAYKMYNLLYNTSIRDKVRFIKCPNGYDASLIFEKFGEKGIIKVLNSARKLDDYEIDKFRL